MIAPDKKKHFAAGAVAGWSGAWLAYILFQAYTVIGALALSLLVGVLKELYDVVIKKTKFDWKDLLATVLGGVTASLMWYGFSFLPGY